MCWAEMRGLIDQERRALHPTTSPEFSPVSPFETRDSALLAAYLSSKAQVESAIREFARTRAWPALNDHERLFLAWRLNFAWEITSILHLLEAQYGVSSYPMTELMRPEEVIEWMLIDVWPYGCGHYLQRKRFAVPAVPALEQAEVA
jgi:hypothetical protein